MSEGPTIKRVPVVIGEHTIALLTLFNKPFDHIEDMWALDWIQEEAHTHHPRSAKALVAAFEDRWSPAFFMALRDEITNALARHDKQYGTQFALLTTGK